VRKDLALFFTHSKKFAAGTSLINKNSETIKGLQAFWT